jgi:pimeloyl-ACP methyl ester carboxylesterase
VTVRRALAALALALSAGGVRAEDPVTLKDMGSFHVGGREVRLSGKPVRDVTFTPGGVPAKVDPNGTYVTGQMYVQYFVPQPVRSTAPLLLWHGGGLTGVTYETTPDGREGWQHWFLARGWPVYVSDAVERGRSGWSMYPDIFPSEPVFLTVENPWERFRIGDGPNSYDPDPTKRRQLPGSQFPGEAYDAFVRQVVPRWTTTDAPTLDAYVAELDRVGPSVVLFHSQGGQFGFKAAQARPDKVRALVAVEPAGIGDPAQAAALKDIPILMIFGDYIATDPRWPKIRENAVRFGDAVKAAGGHVDVIDLPAIGIKGNSHLMMMDRNNLEVAGVIQDWLATQGLYR